MGDKDNDKGANLRRFPYCSFRIPHSRFRIQLSVQSESQMIVAAAVSCAVLLPAGLMGLTVPTAPKSRGAFGKTAGAPGLRLLEQNTLEQNKNVAERK